MSITIYKPVRPWETTIFNDIVMYYQDLHCNITILELTPELLKYKAVRHGVLWSSPSGTFLIDTHDNPDVLAPFHMIDTVFKMQYSPSHVYNSKVKPFVYQCKNMQMIRNSMHHPPEPRSGLFWMGNPLYGRKLWLQECKSILNEDWQERTTPEEYLQRLRTASFALNLKGNGDFCHRMFEAFAMGCPVLSTRLTNITKHQLLPDVHYFVVDKPSDVIPRYHQLIQEPDRIATVARNASIWYDNNCEFHSYMKLLPI